MQNPVSCKMFEGFSCIYCLGSLSCWKAQFSFNCSFSERRPHTPSWRNYVWISVCKLPSPRGSEATPNNNISTTMLHSWFEVLLLKSCLWSVHKTCLVLLWPNNSIFDSCVQSSKFLKDRSGEQRLSPLMPPMLVKFVQWLSDCRCKHFNSFVSYLQILSWTFGVFGDFFLSFSFFLQFLN